MDERTCKGCGDEYPVSIMFEGKSEKHYCAWCLGLNPYAEGFDNENYSIDEVDELFWKEFRKDIKRK